MTAEKELKNIRKMLKISKKDLANSICLSEKDLIKIEKEERKLTEEEIIVICNLLIKIVSGLLSSKNDSLISNNIEQKLKFDAKRDFIVRYISEFIANYQPIEKEINYNDKKEKVLRKINNVDSK